VDGEDHVLCGVTNVSLPYLVAHSFTWGSVARELGDCFGFWFWWVRGWFD